MTTYFIPANTPIHINFFAEELNHDVQVSAITDLSMILTSKELDIRTNLGTCYWRPNKQICFEFSIINLMKIK